jgi:hypothetical protein
MRSAISRWPGRDRNAEVLATIWSNAASDSTAKGWSLKATTTQRSLWQPQQPASDTATLVFF